MRIHAFHFELSSIDSVNELHQDWDWELLSYADDDMPNWIRLMLASDALRVASIRVCLLGNIPVKVTCYNLSVTILEKDWFDENNIR